MKSIILAFSLLFLALIVPQKIEAIEKHPVIETEIQQSRVMLNLSSKVNHIEIENEFLTIQSHIEIYYLEAAAISIDMFLLKAEDDRILFLSYNFKDQTLYYTLKVDGAIYYSSTPLGYENVDLDIFNEDIIQYFVNESSINYYSNTDLYYNFLNNIYSNYKYHFMLKESNPVPFSAEYTFTGPSAGTQEAITLNAIVNSYIFSTVGLHTGSVYDATSNVIRYIYAIQTRNDGGAKPFISLVKVWSIDFYVLNNTADQNKKLIKFNVIDYMDAFVNGNYTSGDITVAGKGSTHLPYNQINSSVEVDGYSYINQFSINYAEEFGSTPEYLTKLDEILGNVVPYYETAKTVINAISNIANNASSLNFNNTIKSFEFNNVEDGNNLKSAGFEMFKTDLYNYSFYQTCQVGGLPDFNTTFSFKIKIHLMSGANISFTDTIQMTKSVCSHSLTTTKVGNNLAIHKIKCSVCNVYYYKDHNYVDTGDHDSICQCGDTLVTGHTFNSFKFINPSIHKATCKCGYSKNESHQKYYSGGKCWACDYKGPIFLPDEFKIKSRDESIECPVNI